MLLILLGPNDFGGDGFNTFGGGSDFGGGDKLPTVPSATSGGSSTTQASDSGGGVPTCPPGKLPFYDGAKWICKAQVTASSASDRPNDGGAGPNEHSPEGPPEPQERGPGVPVGPQPTGGGGSTFTGPNGKPTAAELRAFAKEQGWSEDFERFDDATLNGWIAQFWDVQNKKFRSGRAGVEGLWEKPTECPPGSMPGGPNESDGCVPNNGGGGGGGAGGGAGAGAPAATPKTPAGPSITNYDPRKFTYGNTWGEQNLQPGGAGQVGVKPEGQSMHNCPPGQFPRMMPCFQPPCPEECVPVSGAPIGGVQTGGIDPASGRTGQPFADPGRAMPGSTTSTGFGMLTSTKSLNI